MYDYESFKEIVIRNLPSHFPEVEDLKIEEREVLKINQVKDSIFITGKFGKPGDSGNLQPAIYLDDMYTKYKNGASIEYLLDDVKDRLTRGSQALSALSEINVWEAYKKTENVFFQLINTEANKEMLVSMPHRDFLDMSIIYRNAIYRTEENGIGSVKIDNDVMKDMDLTESELYNLAYKNTEKLFPSVVESLYSYIPALFEYMGADFFPDDSPSPIPNLDEAMYVITNRDGINGATAMLYNENLDKIADRLGTDLYIMPSSIHEVIVVSAEAPHMSLTEYSEMVADANKSVVNTADYLSDNIYRYNRQEKKITQETDVKKEMNTEKKQTKTIKM